MVKDQTREVWRPKQRTGELARAARLGEESRATCICARSPAEGAGSWRQARPLSRLHSPQPPNSRAAASLARWPAGGSLRSHAQLLAVQPGPHLGATFLRRPKKSFPARLSEGTIKCGPDLPPRHTPGTAAAGPWRGGVNVQIPSSPRPQPCTHVYADSR